MSGWRRILLTGLVWAAGLTACAAPPRARIPTVFIPPTAARSPQAGGAYSPGRSRTPQASPTPQCQPQLRYLEDLTIPDGSLVQPGEVLDKRWAVENAGNCNWDAAYSLRLIAGPPLGAPERQPLYPARAGASAVIRILFTAPQESGAYRSAWQAFDPQEQPFGDPIFIEIRVAQP